MTSLILTLVVLNLVAGDYSWRGKRLEWNSHPFFLRLRWLALGWAAALLVTGHDIAADDWLSWITATLLAVGLARVPIKAARKSFRENSSIIGV